MEPDICWDQNLCPYYGGFSVVFLIRQDIVYLIQNSQAVKKCAALKKAMVKTDVISKVAAKKWL